MRITPLSHSSIKCTPIKPQKFNGLFGKPSVDNDFEPALNMPMIKHFYYYHPFADETEAQIATVLKENSDAKMVSDDDGDKYVVKECKRTVPTTFTKADYEKYKKLPPKTVATGQMAEIHNEVKTKYLTSGFFGPQSSAVNKNVTVESQPYKPRYKTSTYHQ